MADAVVKYAESVAATTANSTTWVALASIPNTDFVAGETYLIIANQVCKNNSSSEEVRVRLVHGPTPTVFDDASVAWEGNAAIPAQEHEQSYLFLYTQPGTAEKIELQISASATNVVTNILSQIIAIKLSGDFASGTDYFWNEFLADYTITVTPTAKAITANFTPNGTDRWLFIGHMIHDEMTIVDEVGFELYDSVAGILNSCAVEGEDATNGFRAMNLYWAGVPTNAARTVAVRPFEEAGSNVMLASRVIAINLSKLAQSASAFDAAEVDPATTPTYSTLATVAPTPAATGNWVYLAFSTIDVNAAAVDAYDTRLQVNADGGGLVSDPAYAASPPAREGWDSLDEIPFSVFNLASLSSGGARTINWDVRRSAGTLGRWEDNGLVAFSVALAGAAGAISGTSALVLGQTGEVKGAGILGATSALILGQTGNLAGKGALGATAALTIGQTGNVSGAGALSGTAALVIGQTGVITGKGALASSSALVFGASATADQPSGAISGSSAIVIGQSGALAGAGALAATSALVIGQIGTISGAGALSATSVLVIGQTGAIKGAGALAGSAALVFDATATADLPSGAISGMAVLIVGQSGAVLGNGALGATAALTISESGQLIGSGAMAGTSAISFSAILTVIVIVGLVHLAASAKRPGLSANAIEPSLFALAYMPGMTAIGKTPELSATGKTPSVTATARS